MSTPVRVIGFLLALAAAFGIAFGVGNAVGPIGTEPAAHKAAEHSEEATAAPASDIPGGLMVAQDGYTFDLHQKRLEQGSEVPVAFTITGPDAKPVTAFEVEHDKRLHLIAVRRDFTGYQHVHPVLADDGTWTTTLDLTPGAWRLFADFSATGAEALTLGADLDVAGDLQPAPPAGGETRTATVDGYEVTLDGDLTPGTDAKLTLSVTKGGRPVTDLQPYLGAYGHLVALREGDLAYLHVHPDGTPDDGATRPGPEVVFYAAVPSTGGYRLYLDFKHDGAVRTAAFELTTDDAPAAAPTETPDDQPSEAPAGDGHTSH